MLARTRALTGRTARLLVLLAWMVLISYWSSRGNLPIDQAAIDGPLHGMQHRLAHLFAFGMMGLLARRALVGAPRAAVFAVLLTSAFGAFDEWHQSFTPGRRPAVDDWATDSLAATLAVLVWLRLPITPWRAWLRSLGPVLVAASFVLGVGLAVWPQPEHEPAPPPVSVRHAALRSVPVSPARRRIRRAGQAAGD